MDVLDIARWQFGIITVYHFLFVPVTIGLSALVAGFETAWVRSHDPVYLRLTKFFGKLFLINFAIGVVTGIVQEFQFGMNWSDYSRFVGDVFGAPLAMEGLLAFFLESTFLGLWIFGWDRLPRPLHAATIWVVHLGTLLSSYFILAANSWMQHPVGYTYDPASGRAELTDFWAVMFNKVQLVTFPHVVAAAYMTGGVFVVGVAGYLHLRRDRKPEDSTVLRKALRVGAVVTLVAGLGVAVSGDLQGKVMTEVQPMKMAAAEALYDTEQPASFSVLTVGTPDGRTEKFAIKVPGLLSFLATGHFDGKVEGINQLRTQYQQKYGADPGAKYYSPSDYVPYIPVTYWTFRFMIGVGMLGAAGSALLLWATRRGRTPTGRGWPLFALALPVLVVSGSSFGWLFTEMGRQPWAVFGLMTTRQAVSPGVSTAEAWISVVSLTLLYAVLAVVEVGLLAKYVKAGPPPFQEPPDPTLAGPTGPTGTPTSRSRSPTEETSMELTTVWFVLIAVLWIGYFTLEGFDFGVGLLLPVLARDDTERRVVYNSVGPVWDGNEVWLLVAGGATFAAFPDWYATLFSGFYLPLLLILLGLIVRGLAFEYRAKRDSRSWRRAWDTALVVGSLLPALLWGVAFANLVAGVPIDADKEFTGSLFTLLNPFGLLGGVTTLLLFLTHGAMFLALKTDGEIRHRARAYAVRLGAAAAVVAVVFLGWTQARTGSAGSAWAFALAAVALLGGVAAAAIGREGWAFLGTFLCIGLAVAGLFLALFPDVMPSSTAAAYSLTTTNASATAYSLRVMTWVALVFTPLVMLYQGWSYWVFRRRIGTQHIPAR